MFDMMLIRGHPSEPDQVEVDGSLAARREDGKLVIVEGARPWQNGE